MTERRNQCPRCQLWYGPTDRYCDVDGAQLKVGVLRVPRMVRSLDALALYIDENMKGWRRKLLWVVWISAYEIARKLDPMDLAYDDATCLGDVGEPLHHETLRCASCSWSRVAVCAESDDYSEDRYHLAVAAAKHAQETGHLLMDAVN